MSPAEVDAVIDVALRYDLPVEACDVEIPWLWGEVDDPSAYALHGHVDTDGSITNMRLVSDADGSVHTVPPGFDAMARCDLRDAAVELWGKR